MNEKMGFSQHINEQCLLHYIEVENDAISKIKHFLTVPTLRSSRVL